MATFLFDNIVFGPIKSRRLGHSLGINILPSDSKLCNYNCIYCECGFSKIYDYDAIPNVNQFKRLLEKELIRIVENSIEVDALTFAGNGEPTIHPEFSEIIDETILLRDKYLPKVDIVVLTNVTRINDTKISEALNKIDKAILKIDTLIQRDFELVNCPAEEINIESLPQLIKERISKPIIQTMFFRAEINDFVFDNTSKKSLDIYLASLRYINPVEVMIYSIARDTPISGLQKVSKEELENIGSQISKLGFKVLVTP